MDQWQTIGVIILIMTTGSTLRKGFLLVDHIHFGLDDDGRKMIYKK